MNYSQTEIGPERARTCLDVSLPCGGLAPPRPPRTMRAEDKLCEAAGVGWWTSACMQLIPIIIICAKQELIACRPLSGPIRDKDSSFWVTFGVQIITCN